MTSVFDDLIDQELVIATLKDAVVASRDSSNNSQEMTHSWLFTGPPGSGRSNAAVAFAAALLCENGGCNVCTNCLTVKEGSHADIELIRKEGLSIKVDEVRELITRTSWSPSVGNYRVVVIEDADRLTESAANALLKVIEEPGAKTVWLLCAPTLADVIPTIRSRCRHLNLRTPSVAAVTKLLIERDAIEPKMAEFAASAAQGHIGRAKYLAQSEKAREIRLKILDIIGGINDVNSAINASANLIELAKNQNLQEFETKDEEDLLKLKEVFGSSGKTLLSGGAKAIKNLETEQKNRNTANIRTNVNYFLLDIITEYFDKTKLQLLLNRELLHEKSLGFHILELVSKTRANLQYNNSLQLAIESLFCEILIHYRICESTHIIKQ